MPDIETIQRKARERRKKAGAPFRRSRSYNGRFISLCKNDVAAWDGMCPLIYCPCEYPRA